MNAATVVSVDETFRQLLVFVGNAFGKESREANQVREARENVAELVDAAKYALGSRDDAGNLGETAAHNLREAIKDCEGKQ